LAGFPRDLKERREVMTMEDKKSPCGCGCLSAKKTNAKTVKDAKKANKPKKSG